MHPAHAPRRATSERRLRGAKLAADADKATGAQKQTIEAGMEKLRAGETRDSAWSVTRPERGFHDPERFGYVQFIAPATARRPKRTGSSGSPHGSWTRSSSRDRAFQSPNVASGM